MNFESWSITNISSSASAASVRCWGCHDDPSTPCRPTPVRALTLRIMARIDALSLKDLCSGSRRMAEVLA